MGRIKDRVGEINYNKFGSKMEIIEYRNKRSIDIYFEEYNWILYNRCYDNFKKGTIKCPYEPRVYGKGYLGEGKYVAKINKKSTKEYCDWVGMLKRCYDIERHKKYPTYKNCEVIDEWLNFQNFARWREENYYEINGEKMALDKDIIYKDNKIYSPQTCVFVPERINSLFTKADAIRGNYPIGVTYHKRDKVYEAKLSHGKSRIYLGRYNTIEEAFQSYKIAKESLIKEVADEYKLYIPQKLYEAMYRYEVEIDD